MILLIRGWIALNLFFVLCCGCLTAQTSTAAAPPQQPGQSTSANPTPTIPTTGQQTIVVTGTWEPIPLEEAERSVNSYSVRDKVLLFGSLADVLDLDSSVQMNARAPDGVQADVSIRGGTFEQTLVLLNGIRLSDAQSAHHNFDIPVPLDAIDHIEVLRGAGSTLYGSDAVVGAVNFVTRPDPDAAKLEIVVRSGYGSFGTNTESGYLSAQDGPVIQRFSFEHEISDGFRDDREYRNLILGSETWLRTKLGLTRVFLSLMDHPFGADQFYGPYNSWERTKTWLATLSQDLGQNTLFSLGYRRHTDLFELLRDNPTFYTNRHEDETWDVALRRQDQRGKLFHFNYGAEELHDYVNSNNLGVHSRNQEAIYGAVDVRSLRHASFNAGAREEFYGNAQAIFVPTVSAGYWFSSKFKLRGSVSRAFRLPNYTDLYYHDPADVGNPNLKPEKAMTYEAGLDWHPANRWHASATVFSRDEHDDIDYVRANSNAIWQATNFDQITFTGWEVSLAASLPAHSSLEAQYTGLHGAEGALNGNQSKYVFNYPTQQAVLSWQYTPGAWLARVRVGGTNQYQRNAYALVDVYAAWTRSRFHPYLQLTNLTNTYYQPIYGVPMPGRAAMVGLEICAICPKK